MIYVITLLVIGFAMAFLEVLIPSAGLFGIMSGLSVIAAVMLAFGESQATGYTTLAAVGAGLPTTIFLSFKWLPHSPFGKDIILSPVKETPQQFGQDGVSDEDYASLLGKTGVTDSECRPSGFALIDDQRYDVVSSGEMISDKTPIQVIEIEGNSIVVEEKK